MIDWDFTGLRNEEIVAFECAIREGEDLCWRFSERSLDFILRNYLRLAELGQLEITWLSTYLATPNLQDIGFGKLKSIFDACDRSRLQAHPLSIPIGRDITTERISLFRGCAGPVHTNGMSWTTSLDKAIYYAKWHADLHLKPNQSARADSTYSGSYPAASK